MARLPPVLEVWGTVYSTLDFLWLTKSCHFHFSAGLWHIFNQYIYFFLLHIFFKNWPLWNMSLNSCRSILKIILKQKTSGKFWPFINLIFNKCFPFYLAFELFKGIRGLHYKTLRVRNLIKIDMFHIKLVSFLLLVPFFWTNTLPWINTLAYYRVCTLRIRNVL
jgi:hypothetical protein